MLPLHYYKEPPKDLWLCLGFLLVIYLGWNRFLRERLPKDWTNLLACKYFFLLFALVQLIFICYLVKKILGLSFLPDQALGASLWRARLENLGLLWQNFWRSPYRLLAFLWELQPQPFRPKFYERLCLGPLAEVKLSQVKWWCFLLDSLAPLLPALTFGLEILCFQRLQWFYQSLLILGVVLLWKSSWSVLDYANGRQLIVWENDFFELREDTPGFLQARPKGPCSDQVFAEWSRLWLAQRHIQSCLQRRDQVREYWSRECLLVQSLFYALGSSIIFLVGFYHELGNLG